MLLDKKISQKIAIFKGKYTFGLYQLIFGTYLNVLQCVGLHFLSLVSFIPYVSFIKNSKIGPPCRLFHTWLLFFFSFWVLCVFYSIHVVYSGLKSILWKQQFRRWKWKNTTTPCPTPTFKQNHDLCGIKISSNQIH